MWYGFNGLLHSVIEGSGHNIIQVAGFKLNQQMLPVFMGVLLATVVAWMYLSRKFYAQLQRKYPDLYKKLGSPQPFLHKNFSTNFRIIVFLFKPVHGAILDLEIIRLTQGLRTLFYIYLICLAGSLVLLLQR